MIKYDKFIKNSTYNLLGGGVAACSSFFLPILLIRLMGKEEYSIWMLLLQVGGYLSYFNIGLQTAVARYSAVHDTNKLQAGIYASTGYFFLVVLSLVSFFIVDYGIQRADLIGHIDEKSTKDQFNAVLPIVCFAFATAIPANAVFGYLSGVRDTFHILINNLLVKVLVFVFSLSAAYYGATIQTMGYCLLFAYAIGFIHIFYLIFRKVNGLTISTSLVSRSVAFDLLKYSGASIFWSISMFLVASAGTLIVAKFDFRELAAYLLISTAAALLVNLFLSMFNNLMPEFARLDSITTPEEKAHSVIESTKLIVFLIALVFGGLLFVPFEIFDAWFSKAKTENSITIFYLVMYGSLFRLVALPYSMHLLATNQQRLGIATALFEGVITVVMSILFSNYYGAIGVGIGLVFGAISGFFANVLVNFKKDKKIKFVNHSYINLTVLKFAIPLSFVVPILIWFRMNGSFNYLVCAIGVVLYTILCCWYFIWGLGFFEKSKFSLILLFKRGALRD